MDDRYDRILAVPPDCPDGERLMTVVRRHENVTRPDAAKFRRSECGARKVTPESEEVRRPLEELQAER